MVRMAAATTKKVNTMMANLRSDGRMERLRSTKGTIANPARPRPGMSTPATCGSKYDSSSWSPRKYQGAFDGLGWALGLASSRSGASWKIENTISRPSTTSRATNSMASRCGHTLTLSVGSRLTCWIAFALTTVSNRWVRTPSGIAGAAGAAVGAGVVAVAVAGAAGGGRGGRGGSGGTGGGRRRRAAGHLRPHLFEWHTEGLGLGLGRPAEQMFGI